MIEVEAKARSEPDTIQKILGLGGKLVGIEHHCDAYFNSPHHDFRRSDEALRIRVKDGGARLTYKGRKIDSQTKSRLETTVEIDDPVAMENILLALGFVRAGQVRKVRTKYALGDAVLACDEVEGLGSFLEVEIAGSDFGYDQSASSSGFGSDEAEAGFREKRGRVMAILASLGLHESIRESYLELLSKSGHLI